MAADTGDLEVVAAKPLHTSPVALRVDGATACVAERAPACARCDAFGGATELVKTRPPPWLVTPAVPPFSRVTSAPDPYVDALVGALLLTTPELEGTRAPLEVSPPEELRCPAALVPLDDDRDEAAPLAVPEAVDVAPLTEPLAVAALLGAAAVAGAGAGAGAGTAAAAVAGALAVDGGGGAGGVEGVP